MTLRVSRHRQSISGRSVSVAMRDNENAPFSPPHKIITDDKGQAQTSFDTMWNAMFLVIPPLGLVPSHPPKPVYAVAVDGKQVVVSKDTPGATYRWEHGSWHTDAAVTLP